MGTLVGHVLPGVGFLLIGLWHLFSHTKRHSLNPTSYISPAWFPFPRFRYLEPALIMIGTATSIAMELFISPARHQPFDDDWTIPSNHLHTVEHCSISLAIFTYGAFIIAFDRSSIKDASLKLGLTLTIGAIAFGQELLMFHLHSTDHIGVEGHYHWLLQLIAGTSLVTTIASVSQPRSFLVSYVRSASIAFQGVWFIVMGYALWTPCLIPKGCFMNMEDGHYVVRCHDQGSLERAKSLANIEFSLFLVGMVVAVMVFYMVVSKGYDGEHVPYVALDKKDEDNLESQKKLDEAKMFAYMGESFESLEVER